MQVPDQYPESVTRLISATEYLSNIGQAIGHTPHAKFSNLFIERPGAMAPLLRQLCSTRDRRRYSLLISWPYPTARYYHALALAGAGFTVAILEMLTDDEWFMELKETSQEGTMSLSKFAFIHALFLLTRLASLKALEVNSVQELCDNFPAFWATLWKHRKIVLAKPFVTCPGDVLDSVYQLISCNMQAWIRLHGIEHTPPLTYVGHVSLYLWLTYPPQDHREHVDLLCASHVYPDITDPAGVDYIKEAVRESVGDEDLSIVIWRVLIDAKLDSAMLLERAYRMVGLFTQVFGRTLTTPAHKYLRVMLALTKSFQRLLCVGDMGTFSPELVGRRILGALHGLVIFDNDAVVRTLKEHLSTLHFVPVVAHTLTWACTTVDADTYWQSWLIIAILTDYGKSSRFSANKSQYFHLRHVIRAFWLPTLSRLRNARQSPAAANVRTLHGRAIPPEPLKDGIKRWIELGKTYDLTENDARSSPAHIGDLDIMFSSAERWIGCCMKECPCFGRKPLHGMRRVCTGCWLVFYCGPRCQARDWQLGHRNVCGGRSRQHT